MQFLKVRVDDKEIETRAIFLEDPINGIVRMIDQRFLPWRLVFYDSASVEETSYAIRNFIVRGALTIGAAAAFGAYQAVLEASRNSTQFLSEFINRLELLKNTRPTAYNLFHALNSVCSYVSGLVEAGVSIRDVVKSAREFAINYVENEIIEKNKKIGEIGEKVIENEFKVLTHCNAGALAAVDIGTATAPIYYAHRRGKKITVYVSETRPWLQGARLTAWELSQAGIEVYVISDNAVGYLMQTGEIDVVIVGADRICKNGDTINKIGTYKIALAAHDNGIPFYVAAPSSTIDPTASSGREVVVEERSEDEIHFVFGELENGMLARVRITPMDVRAKNPIFDITPARLITGFITEFGIIEPDSIGAIARQS
ncbi:MAG: S-methyl-5-thioribose-1-phosphate isomerase [Candidatus Korarchaeota archaeon]